MAEQTTTSHTSKTKQEMQAFLRRLDEFRERLGAECQRRWKNPHFVGLEFPSFGWCI
jgi:hypothetical protein